MRVARPMPPGSRSQRALHKSGPDPGGRATVGSPPRRPCNSRVPTQGAVQKSGNRAGSSRIPDISTWGVLISGLLESASRFPEKCTVVGGLPSRHGHRPLLQGASGGPVRARPSRFSGRTGDHASAAKPTYLRVAPERVAFPREMHARPRLAEPSRASPAPARGQRRAGPRTRVTILRPHRRPRERGQAHLCRRCASSRRALAGCARATRTRARTQDEGWHPFRRPRWSGIV
jgi:hypothetical protein